MAEAMNTALSTELGKMPDIQERTEFELALKEGKLSDQDQIKLAQYLSNKDGENIRKLMNPVFSTMNDSIAKGQNLPGDAAMGLSLRMFPQETYSAFVQRSDAPNKDISETFDAILKPGATPKKEDFDKAASAIRASIEKGEPITRGNIRKITEVIDRIPDLQKKKAVEGMYPKIAKGLIENGYSIESQKDIDFLKKLDPKVAEEVKHSIPEPLKPCLLQYANNRYEVSSDGFAGGMDIKALKKVGTLDPKLFKDIPISAPNGALSPKSAEAKDALKTVNDAVTSPASSPDSKTNKDAQDAIDSMIASDNTFIRGLGNMLKAFMSVVGMYKSPAEGADAGKEWSKEASPDVRTQKIDEMMKKGESKAYFPTEVNKDSLKEITLGKDPKENDRRKSERAQYIVDTRTALGLPTDKSDKNLYDAEVVKAVKEIQKKSGLKETGLFDKKTATQYQESIKTAKEHVPKDKAVPKKFEAPGKSKDEFQS